MWGIFLSSLFTMHAALQFLCVLMKPSPFLGVDLPLPFSSAKNIPAATAAYGIWRKKETAAALLNVVSFLPHWEEEEEEKDTRRGAVWHDLTFVVHVKLDLL